MKNLINNKEIETDKLKIDSSNDIIGSKEPKQNGEKNENNEIKNKKSKNQFTDNNIAEEKKK